MLAIDHLAFPCFDVSGTHLFYTELLGGVLRHAQSGAAREWNANEYLLIGFELPGGAVIDFFTFDGIRKPASDGLPKDIRHIGLSVRTRAEVIRFLERFKAASVPFWTETHDVDDVHVYATDPNGVILEILAEEDSIRARRHDEDGAKMVVARWLKARTTSTTVGDSVSRGT
jgi:catechol 2,3-dioxygenase-like lactoylglutathione lyase family enzyme